MNTVNLQIAAKRRAYGFKFEGTVQSILGLVKMED